MRARAFPFLAAAVTLLVASSASAYNRTTVDGDPLVPLFWPRRTIAYHVAFDTFLDQQQTAGELAVRRSFDTWALAARGGALCTDLEFDYRGQPNGYNTNLYGSLREGDGQNIIVWRDDAPPFMAAWPPPPRAGEAPIDPNALAVTTLVYRRTSGEIIDADIDLNAVSFYWTVLDADVVTDVQNTLTHEIGHLIGFAHAPEAESTMYASSPPGELVKRDLSADDIEGVCYVYPRGLDTPGAPGRASSGLTAPTLTGEGCSTLRPARRTDSQGGRAALAIGLALGAFAWVRSRRRRSSKSE